MDTNRIPLDIEKIIAFEEGNIAEDDLIELFQGLVNTGNAWTLQGFYGRTACQLIAEGLVNVPDWESLPFMAREHISALRADEESDATR